MSYIDSFGDVRNEIQDHFEKVESISKQLKILLKFNEFCQKNRLSKNDVKYSEWRERLAKRLNKLEAKGIYLTNKLHELEMSLQK